MVAKSPQKQEQTERKIRVLIAKPGLDGHDRGAKIIARALRDAGMEVIYTGLHQTPEMIAEAALQEDVDAVGLSILSGAHMALFPRIIDELRQARAGRCAGVRGGHYPRQRYPGDQGDGHRGRVRAGHHNGGDGGVRARARDTTRGRRGRIVMPTHAEETEGTADVKLSPRHSTIETLVSRLLQGDRGAASRLMTVVENRQAGYRETLRRVTKHTGRAHIIGVTGSPGAGKSTLVNELIKHYRRAG